MEIAALIVAGLALVLAWSALSKANRLVEDAQDGRSNTDRVARNLGEEIEEKLQVLRRLTARIHAGEPLTREMILEGRLWDDVSSADGQRLVAQGELHVLDVRTPQERAAGIIPGARLIPVDEIEARRSELPRDGKPVLVYCAGGGRSAAACELLSQQGHDGLLNLTGGFGGWSGPTARPE